MEEVVICSYSTLAGARKKRREIGGCIIRILADPDDIFVVVPSFLQTKIMSVDDEGKCDGSISLMDLTSRADDTELTTLRAQNEGLREVMREALACLWIITPNDVPEGAYKRIKEARNALAQVAK